MAGYENSIAKAGAHEMDDFDCAYRGAFLAGVDEVGRGPLAGPVVAAAVILDPAKLIDGLTDSKKISEKKRERLYDEIRSGALAWSIAQASVEEIDRLNILHASMLAMKRAVDTLRPTPEHVLVDGNRVPDLDMPAQALVKGDMRVACISAASILAKVWRDRHMLELDREYPGYGLAKHKGYPTKAHLAALNELGVTEIYRKSFAPVSALISS